MFSDARDLSDGELLSADVCIVGAGAAGITIARDLIGSGLRVILLESGGDEREAETQALYRGDSTGLFGSALSFCRLRLYGGSTNHWAGWCQPIESDVFEAREGIDKGWPIGRDELLPWYHKAHDTCGLGAFEYEADPVARRAKKSVLAVDASRVSQVLYQYSEPRRFGSHYREALEDASDLAVYLYANLVDIQMTESGDAVQRVNCATLEGTRFGVVAGRFVLALGGIENARMLLASRSQDPKGVGNGQDLVGRCFMEHPHFYNAAGIAVRSDLDMSFFTRRHQAETVDELHPEGIRTRLMAALTIAPGLCTREGLVKSTFQVVSLSEEDARRHAEAAGADRIGALIRGAGSQDIALYNVNIRAEQRPVRDSRVTLDDSDEDALGVSRAVLHWKVAEEDLADIRRSLELLAAEFGRSGIGRLWMPADDRNHALYPVDRIREGCHHMGTTRMADSSGEGVVDKDCRVHGLANLYIAGSSVFPAAGSANPTLTIVALAHRLADKLRESAS